MTSLLQHRNSRYFKHDFLHSAFEDRSREEIGKEDRIATTTTNTAFRNTTTVKENLEDESLDCSPGCDSSSLVSLTSSLPSSLFTDPPPSLFSYSSYETHNPPKETDSSPAEVSPQLKSCTVDIRKMSTFSWGEPTNKPDPGLANRVSADKRGNNSQQENNSQSTDIDILDFSEHYFHDETLEDITEEYHDDYAIELNELQHLVQGCGFSSILDLHLNISNIIERTPLESPDCDAIRQELRAHYLSLVQEVFPWFSPEEPARHWSEWEPGTRHSQSSHRDYIVKPPSSEHSYCSRKRKALSSHDCQPTELSSEPDLRKCVLCGVSGEEEEKTGRLLPFRYNEWLHLSCALWSSEVYETVDGSLQQVLSAVTRSRNLLCTVCHQKGATIGCCHQDCPANFHFLCGIQDKADFKEDKTVYCYKHAQKYASKENVASFEAERFIWIDADPEEEKSRPGKHKSKFVDYRNLKFSSGALRIDSLGSLVLASDTEKVNFVINFTQVHFIFSPRLWFLLGFLRQSPSGQLWSRGR